MLPESVPDHVRSLLLDALVTYSDSCTLPNLTPSCPYFVQTEAGPTCLEQCRELIAEWGVADRGVRDVQIGGLVLHGRRMPRSVASGSVDYDATQRFLSERRKSPNEQGTGSLLLGLKAAFVGLAIDTNESASRVMPLWAELERRGVNVESLVTAAMLPEFASRIATVAAMPAMREGGLWGDGVSSDVLDALQQQAESGWSQLLEAAMDAEGGLGNARKLALDSIQGAAHRSQAGGPQGFSAEFAKVGSETGAAKLDWVLADVRMLYAMSPRFRNRVAEWLTRLLHDDLPSLLRLQPPPVQLFLALSTDPAPIDEIGLWIWDRFTQTHFEDWSTSSLMKEWLSATTGEAPLAQPVWSERRTDAHAIASIALSKSSEQGGLSLPERGLGADEFVNAAIAHLREGRIQEAADIFAGLVELRPADGDALNNLGFCLLPIDPIGGLDALQKASLYPRGHVFLNMANRVLALHLVGRDDDALPLAREAVAFEHYAATEAFLWIHVHDSGTLTLAMVDPVHYMRQLLNHLESEGDVEQGVHEGE